MACNLRKDPEDRFDALSAAGRTATVFIRSDASPDVKITAATFNRVPVEVGDDGRIDLPSFRRNTNVLNLTIEGVQPGDDIQLVEECETGETLSTKTVGSAPGGADPVMGFRISAS